MVQYEGHVTKDGEVVVSLEGNELSLHEFLQVIKLAGRSERHNSARERRGASSGSFAVAK